MSDKEIASVIICIFLLIISPLVGIGLNKLIESIAEKMNERRKQKQCKKEKKL